MSSWSTACGWNFAVKSSDFYFVSGKVTDKLKCSKCELLMKSPTSQREENLRLDLAVTDTAVDMAYASKPSKRRKTNADTPTQTK